MKIADFAMSADEIVEELKSIFSDPYIETYDGVVVAGGHMTPDLLVYAYNHGIFPWPHEGYPLLWFSPDERGVIDFDELHLPKSFLKWIKKNRHHYRISINTNFEEVIENCKSQKRQGQVGTWINSEIELNYKKLFKMGRAFSLEVWREEALVGGIYGVCGDKYYSCESMFHKEDNTSKLALYELILHLKAKGHTWMDIQMVTSVCESFGGKLISKNEFLNRIGF